MNWPDHEVQSRANYSYLNVLRCAQTYHRVLFAILYDLPVSLDDFASPPRQRGIHVRDLEFIYKAIDSVSTIGAYAKYYGCGPKIAHSMAQLLMEHSLFWQSVADKPLKYLQLGECLKSKDIYLDSLRYIIANSNNDHATIADYVGLSEIEARNVFGARRNELTSTVLKLEHDLMRLQLTKSWATYSCQYWTVPTTFFNAIRYKKTDRFNGEKMNERSDLLARGIWGQWLAQQTAGEYVYIFNKQRNARAGPLTAALNRLEEVAQSADPTSSTSAGFSIRRSRSWRP